MALGTGLGEFPLGGFADADSQSVGDPLAGLVSEPWRPRKWLFRGYPLSGGAEVNVDHSGGGYTSLSSDAPYKHFPPGLIRPGNFTVSLPDSLHGGASAGFGEIVLENSDGRWDSEAAYDWQGRKAEVYLGPPYAALSQFTRVLSGVVAGINKNLDNWQIGFRDATRRLERSFQPRKYWGFGPCLRFDGSGDWVDYGDILNMGATDSFVVEVLARSAVAGTLKALVSKKQDGSAGSAGWRFEFGTGDSLFFNISDGTTSVSASVVAAGYLDGELNRYTAEVDRVAQVIRVRVDGVLVATSASIAAVGSLANAVALRVGSLGGGTDVWSGDLDDFRLWPAGTIRTQAQIQATMHRELTATEATGCAIYTKFSEGSGTTVADSSGNGRTGTITGATWIGSLEGDSALAGKPKPKRYGVRRQVSLIPVDTQRLVYQLNDGSMKAVNAVRDSGDPVTFGSSVSDIYSTTPTAGTYNKSLSQGLVRFGSTPVGVLTADIEGDNGGILGYQDTAAGCLRKDIVEQGGFDNGTEIDAAAFTALLALDSSVVGFSFADETTVKQAADLCVSSIWAWWSPTRTSTITCGRVKDPATESPSVFLTDVKDIVEGGLHVDAYKTRVGEVLVHYRPYEVVLTDDQVAGVVALETRVDFGLPERVVSARDPDRTEDADVLEIHTSVDLAADAQALADMILAFLKRDLELVSLPLQAGLFSYYLGTIVRLTATRWDYTGGRNLVVISLSEDFSEYTAIDKVTVTAVG